MARKLRMGLIGGGPGSFYKAVRDYERDPGIDVRAYDFPDLDDGLHGMAIVDTVVRSARSEQKWTALP